MDGPAPLAFFAGILAAVCWAVTRIDYRIAGGRVAVVFFGATLRSVALSDIAFADRSAAFWNEHWCNTFLPWKRVVRIRRKSGWVKNFLITPADPDRFLDELRRAAGTPSA